MQDPELQANAAGAIQSVCFLPDGREHVLGFGGVQVCGLVMGSWVGNGNTISCHHMISYNAGRLTRPKLPSKYNII